jgi:hypothetical protein
MKKVRAHWNCRMFATFQFRNFLYYRLVYEKLKIQIYKTIE